MRATSVMSTPVPVIIGLRIGAEQLRYHSAAEPQPKDYNGLTRINADRKDIKNRARAVSQAQLIRDNSGHHGNNVPAFFRSVVQRYCTTLQACRHDLSESRKILEIWDACNTWNKEQ